MQRKNSRITGASIALFFIFRGPAERHLSGRLQSIQQHFGKQSAQSGNWLVFS